MRAESQLRTPPVEEEEDSSTCESKMAAAGTVPGFDNPPTIDTFDGGRRAKKRASMASLRRGTQHKGVKGLFHGKGERRIATEEAGASPPLCPPFQHLPPAFSPSTRTPFLLLCAESSAPEKTATKFGMWDGECET
jgi:hypothetical protein